MDLTVIIYKKEGNIGHISINRPNALNSLSNQVIDELGLVIEQVGQDPEVKAVILTGEGRAFVAGADISGMVGIGGDLGEAMAKKGSDLFRKIEMLPIPVIAAVYGFALGGGCELAMSCDIRIASDKAKFGQPEVALGIIPGYGGTQRLPRLVGMGRAKELIYTGDIIRADEAFRIGLVNKVVAPEDLMGAAVEMATKIMKQGPIAVKNSKLAIDFGMSTDLESGLAKEIELFGECFGSEDCQEGVKAFLEKRPANFHNR